MATTDSRSGFRLPWTSDRAHDAQAVDEPVEAAVEAAGEPAASAVAWSTSSDLGARLGLTPASSSTTDETASPPTARQEPAMIDTDPVFAPAPAMPKRPSQLMANLAAAIRATAEAAREQALAQVDGDVAAAVADIRTRSKDGETGLRQRSDEDIAGIREWSKAEIARIKEETEAKIEARKASLGNELGAHAAAVERNVVDVEGRAAEYRAEMQAYADRLGREDDPSRLATLAESMPEPPVLGVQADAAVAMAQPPVSEAEAAVAPAFEPEPVAFEPEAVAFDAEPVASQAEPVAFEAAAVALEPEPMAFEAEPAVAAVASGAPVVAADAPVVEATEPAPPKPAGPTPSPWGGPDSWGISSRAAASAVAAGAAADEVTDAFAGGDVAGNDQVERGTIMAALEVAAEAAAGSADEADAAALEPANEDVDPEAEAAFSARVDAGGFDTDTFASRLAALLPPHSDDVAPGGEPRTTQVVVSGLVSVASIASFKRHLGRMQGVRAVAVASGPEGEFVFNVTHESDVAFRDAIPTMPGFAARVTSSGDGVVTVAARDPESEG
jgi:hypothetical protein